MDYSLDLVKLCWNNFANNREPKALRIITEYLGDQI